MMEQDEYGKDPAVKAMRNVFKGMELSQKRFFESLHISSNDFRLRNWREKALGIFEKAWSLSVRMAIPIDDKGASGIYILALAKVLEKDGFKIPEEILPDNSRLEDIIDQIV